MYVCIYVCVYIYIYIHTYVHIGAGPRAPSACRPNLLLLDGHVEFGYSRSMYISISLSLYIYIYINKYVYIYIYIGIHIYMYSYDYCITLIGRPGDQVEVDSPVSGEKLRVKVAEY